MMKNSQGKMVLLFMSIQLLSCLYLFSLSDSAVVEIVLKEMWDFVNFSKYKPVDLWIFWSSLFRSLGSQKSFKELF